MNLHDPGLLHTSGFGTGLLMATINYKYPSAVSSASVGLVYNRNWYVIIPEIQCWCCHHHSHCSLEGESWGRDDKYCGDGLLGYADNEVRVSCVCEERGELVVCWITQINKGKEWAIIVTACWMHFQSWKIMCQHVVSTTTAGASCWIT